jgi:O-antigen ligase
MAVFAGIGCIIVFTDMINQIIGSVGFSQNNVLYRFISLLKLITMNNQNLIVDTSTLERLNLIKYAWLLFLENPLFGHGLGAFKQLTSIAPYYGIVAIFNNTYSHVEVLELLVGTGVVGTFLYYTGIKSSISYKKDSILLFSMIITSILACFTFRINFDKTIWWILIAINHLYSQKENDVHEE